MNALPTTTQRNLIPLPPGKQLRAFQVQHVDKILHFLRHNETNSAYECSDPGCGKTIIAIATLNVLKPKKIVVITPASMAYTWQEELIDWSTFDYQEQLVLKRTTKLDPDANIYIIPDSIFWWKTILNQLKKQRFDVLIADENHRFNSGRNTKRGKALYNTLWRISKKKISLSGTPFTTRIIDAFPAFRAHNPTNFNDFWTFAYTHSFVTKHRFGHDFYGVKRINRLRRIIRENFYLRDKKEDVIDELPEKTYQTILLSPEYAVVPKKEEKAELRKQTENLKKSLEEDAVSFLPTSLAEHRQLQALKKLPPIIDFILDKLENKVPLVVFAWHKEVIREIKRRTKKYKPAIITGDTSPRKRHLAVKRFQSGETDLFVGNITAAGVGITLTRSSHVVRVELSYAPSDNLQAADRCCRIGQKNAVTVYTFIVQDSLEEELLKTVLNRERVFGKVLDRK